MLEHFTVSLIKSSFEPSLEKTNNVVSEEVWHKSGCTG